MNKWFFYLVAALTLTAQMAAAQDVKVVSSIEENDAHENLVLKGTVTVTHNQQDRVDQKSFLLDNEHLSVELIDTIKISPADPLQISIFRFTLPAKPKGLYVLPSISVSVGGKRFSSSMSSFEVQAADGKSAQPSQGATPSAPPPASSAPSASVPRSGSGRTNVWQPLPILPLLKKVLPKKKKQH